MAKMVLGMATSHAPGLNGSSDRWTASGERDMRGPTGGGMPMNLDLDAMVRERESWIDKELKQEVFDRRHNVCQKAIATLSETLKHVSPDVVVIVGMTPTKFSCPRITFRLWMCFGVRSCAIFPTAAVAGLLKKVLTFGKVSRT